jgi:hypothetical protein
MSERRLRRFGRHLDGGIENLFAKIDVIVLGDSRRIVAVDLAPPQADHYRPLTVQFHLLEIN